MDKPNIFKAALLNWLGLPIEATNSAFWQGMNADEAVAGKHVSVNSAIQISTVWACIRLLSETVSTLPLRVYRKSANGGREIARDHPLHALLCAAPNAEMTPGRFMLFIVASLMTRGNAYVEKQRIGRRVVALNPLLPQGVAVRRNDAGRLEYDVALGKGHERVIAADDMLHIRGFGLDGVCGLQTISAGRQVIGTTTAANEAAAKIFEQGLQASGFLSGDATMSDKQRSQMRDSLERFHGSKNAGKLMVLEAGLKYQGITMNPESAQMLQTRAFNVEEICRWFGVPPFMVGHMDKASSWASSVEAQNLHFLTSCLRPILDNIEQEIIRCLVPRDEWGEIYAEFSVQGLLRADSGGRAAYYNSALQNGWMSRNEIRALENEAPIEGGDVYTVQSNLIPLDKLGANIPSNTEIK